MSDDYEQQAKDFLENTGTKFEAKFLENRKYFDDDKDSRDVYEITLTRGERKYAFTFGQSINASGKYFIYTPEGKKTTNEEHGRLMKYRQKGLQVQKNHQFKEPTPYDVLAAMTKYEPGSFENFCSDYGYEVDSRKAEKTYNAVKKEYDELCKLYNEKEMQELGEIA